ncbi:OLC1v1002620C1 [Oldenlandia corymbosa var. corymbosa]|uniref:OLC1v1002620C1 n=1 Tax=Oldenlandia corymbosa var. corymbosa TaxID=529605 RepID=A0AAV1D9Q7_OLDCO|nr:OLC1v1002620C1 [Oldenlandia corymbosa var. corymbosa]
MEVDTTEKGKGSERWSSAITNLSEMAANLDSLQKLLVKKAVYVDDETFAKASISSEQARTIKMMYTRETNPDVPSSACIKPCEFCFMIKEEVDLTEIYFLLQLLEQRVETLERELDAAISAAARARNEKRQAEAAQKAAELRSLEVTKELENTTSKHLPLQF